MNKFDSGDIIKKFKELEASINKLWCFVEECCAKIPINIGNGVGLFKRLYRNKWEFKSIVAGDNVTITEQDNTITINSTATPFTCEDVNDCLGISEAGAANKYLNEQGDFITIGGGGFSCSDLNNCSTTNLPEGLNLYYTQARFNSAFAAKSTTDLAEGSNLYFTNTRAINALAGTPTYVNYYSPSTGLITGDQYFTRLNTGRTRIWGDIIGQDGGYLDLTPIGTSYFGVNNAGSLDNYFWVTGSNIGWAWNSTEFILPTTDGNSGYVLTTNGAGILSFQTPSGGIITAISDTNTIDLVDTLGTLTANIKHQNTATINLSEDASGLKADFASMNISQFTNNSNYVDGTGASNEIAYFTDSNTIDSLDTATYPSLTELSYVKGVTSSIQTQFSGKVNTTTQRTGTSIAFDVPANYGTESSPETGNITGDYTGAVIGVTQLIIHNNGTEPTVPATWKKRYGFYTVSTNNYIVVEWLSSNIAIYTIL